MNKILVCGGYGFVGRAVVDALLRSHADVELHVTSRTTKSVRDDFHTHQIDLLDQQQVYALIEQIQPTHLIQLAWCANPGTYWTDAANLDWLKANINIAKAFVANGGRRCFFTGTSAEYDWGLQEPLKETAQLKPLKLYGASKLALFYILSEYFEQEKVSWAWGRLFNPFGPGEDRKRLIPKTCLRLLAGVSIRFDAALSLRDFLHVSDIGDAITAILFSDVTGAINVGAGVGVSVRTVVETIAACLDSTDRVFFEDAGGSEIRDMVVADTRKLREETAWQPAKSFRERLAETCEWWKNNQ